MSGTSPGAAAEDTTARDAVALLMAAMRDDQMAVAVLVSELDVQRAREVAIFCAYTATRQFEAVETARSTPGLFAGVLEDMALQIASRDPAAPPH